MRVKRGVTKRAKHKKILKLAKGYQFGRGKLYKQAADAVLHAGQYAFAGRRAKKRNMRALWITRINAALSQTDVSYSQFIHNLKSKKIALDRKVLSEMAIAYPVEFSKLIEAVSK